MGRGLKAGKSHRQRLGDKVTWADLNEAQAKIDEQYDKLYAQASLDSAKTIQNMFYYTLLRLGYGIEGVRSLEEEMHNVNVEIEHGELTFPQLYSYLEEHGVEAAK